MNYQNKILTLLSVLALLLVFSCGSLFSQEKKDEDAKDAEKPVPKTAAQLRAEELAKRMGRNVEKDDKKDKNDKDDKIDNTENADVKKDESPQNQQEQRKIDSATSHLTSFEIQDQQKPKQKVIVAPDRTVSRSLEQAKQLVERERIPEAVRMISTILEGNDDFFFESEINQERITNQTFKRAAEELLLSLPEEGRRMYALNNDPLALRLLKNAVETGSVELLEKIVDSYFYTESGNTAAFLLAMNRYDQGARGSAVLLFRRLAEESKSLDVYEPTFSLTFASCELALGHFEAAQKVLEDFLRRNPNPKIQIAGNEVWNPSTVEEMLQKLQSWNKYPNIADWIETSGWLTSTGTSAQNTQVQASPPLLELVWKLQTITQPKLHGIIRLIEGQMRRTQSTFIPTARPVVVGNTLIFQAYDALVGVNTLSGKRVWIGKTPEYHTKIFDNVNQQHINYPYGQSINQWLTNLLRLQLWHNPAMGSPSSDGRFVFNIEEIPDIDPYSSIQRFGGRANTPHEDPRRKFSTTLTARDARTGEVVWRVGKAVFVQKQLVNIEKQMEAERLKYQREVQKKVQEANQKKREQEIARKKKEQNENQPNENQPEDKKDAEKQDDSAKLKENENKESENKNKENENKEKESGKENEADENDTETKIPISPEEVLLGDTYFLGPPLPVLGNLFVLGENGGIIRLFIFDIQTGKLMRHIGLLEPPTPLESDILRRFRGSSPAHSEGIIICPTACGAVIALDAASGKLVWGYTYSDQIEEPEGNRQQRMFLQQQRRGLLMGQLPLENFNGQTDEYQFLVDHIGWQIPSTMIENGKVIFAPADRPMLYCFDLLTGELLWKRSKGKGRYIACIHSNKVIVVAQDSLVALDLETGKSLWNDQGIAPLPDVSLQNMYNRPVSSAAAQLARRVVSAKRGSDSKTSLPHVAFPEDVFPSGVGVKYGNEYMISMSDRSILVVDLDTAKVVRSWKSFDSSQPGNLVAIGGRIFSQSATEVLCFHQFEKLRTQVQESLQLNPEDSEAIMHLGRLAYVEGNREEAIRLLQKAIALNSNPQNRNTMRLVLADALQSDFEKYRIPLEDLEKLQDEPESLIPLLHAYIQGSVKIQDYPLFIVAFRKIMDLDLNRKNQYLIQHGTNAQLSLTRWTGLQVERFSKVPELSDFFNSLAQEEFERITALTKKVRENDGKTKEVRTQWKKYINYFASNSLSRDARRQLMVLLDQDRQISEMEFLLNLPLNDRLASWKEPSSDSLMQNVKRTNLANNKSLSEWEIISRNLPSQIEEDKKILSKTLALLNVKKEAEAQAKADAEKAKADAQAKVDAEKADEKEKDNANTNETNIADDTKTDSSSEKNSEVLAKTELKKTESAKTELAKTEPDTDGKAAEIFQVAQLLTQVDELESAVHYDRLLGTQFANVQFATKLTAESTLEMDESAKMVGSEVLQHVVNDPKLQSYLYTKDWPDKFIDFQDRTEDDAKRRSEYFSNLLKSNSVYNNLHFSPYDNMAQSFNMISLVDDSSSFFKGCTFSVQMNEDGVPELICWDQSGKKKWNADISHKSTEEQEGINHSIHYGNESFSYSGTIGFLRACNHVIYYVQGKRMIAIDTLKRDKFGRAAVLWSRSLESAFGPIRTIKRALRIQAWNHFQYVYSNDASQAGNAVCVLPNIICFQDLDRLYGVDPLTGEMIWSKESLAYQSILIGDDQYVYQIRSTDGQTIQSPIRNAYVNNPSRTFEVAVLNAETGEEEVKHKISFLPIHSFGSRIVTCTPRTNTAEQRIEVYDLRDILAFKKSTSQADLNAKLSLEQKRKLALSTDAGKLADVSIQGVGTSTTSKTSATTRTAEVSIKPRFTSKALNDRALVNFAENGRILTVLTQARELLLFDLATLNHYGYPSAPQYLPRMVGGDVHIPNAPNMNQCQDFHVEFDGKDFLVILIWDQNINSRTGPAGAANRQQTQRSVLPGFAQRSIGRGTVMRYSQEGKPMWSQAQAITNKQFLEFPSLVHSPVLLFGAQTSEKNLGSNTLQPVIWGMNKKTGEEAFGKLFDFSENAQRTNRNLPGNRNTQFRNFIRIFVDPQENALIFSSPTWSVWGFFLDKKIEPTQEESSDAEKTSENDDSQTRQPVKKLPEKSLLPGFLRTLRNQLPKEIPVDIKDIPDIMDQWE